MFSAAMLIHISRPGPIVEAVRTAGDEIQPVLSLEMSSQLGAAGDLLPANSTPGVVPGSRSTERHPSRDGEDKDTVVALDRSNAFAHSCQRRFQATT